MTVRAVDFDEEAEAELDEALRWDRARDAALPGRTPSEVDTVVTAIAQRPESFPRGLGLPTEVEVRRARLRRVPYALVFVEAEDRTRVLAVAHLRRRPLYWAA